MSFATLRQFLARAADDFALQVLETPQYFDAVEAALNKTGRWHQRECALKAPLVVWLILAGTLYRDKSWASILSMVLSQYRIQDPSLSLRVVTPEAACHARARLGFEPVAEVFRTLSKDAYGTVSFYEFRVWSTDGTLLTIPDTPENEAAFVRPTASRGHTAYPQVHMTSLTDTITREVKDVVLGRSDKINERADVVQLIEHLGLGDLLLMDMGISAAWLFKACRRRGVHVLARIPSTWKPKIVRENGPGDYVVQVAPKDCPGVRLKLRMIEYQVGDDQPVRLLTSLMDRRYRPRDIALLYHARWESELIYDEQKVHLAPLQHGKQKTLCRSKSPDGVRQEVYGMLTAYNLVRRTMAEAADTKGLDPRHLSFVETLRLIELATPAYQRATSDTERSAVWSRLLQDIVDTLNPRPRRPRHYPRCVKIKMSNYALKRSGGRYRDYETELKLVRASGPGSTTASDHSS